MAYLGPSSPGWTRTTDRLLVRELPSPLGHRTVLERGVGIAECGILLFRVPHSEFRIEKSGSRETRTHKSPKRPPVFKTGSSSSRMTSWKSRGGRVERLDHRRAMSPRAVVSQLSTLNSFSVTGAGIEPADTWFKATYFYQQKLPRIGFLWIFDRGLWIGSTVKPSAWFCLLFF